MLDPCPRQLSKLSAGMEVTARSLCLTVFMFQGWLTFSGSRVSMQFSVPRDQRAFEQPRVQSDWICAKVGFGFCGSTERKILILCNLFSAVFRTSAEETLVSSATLHGLNMILHKSMMRLMKLAHTRQTVSITTFVTFYIVVCEADLYILMLLVS